jgi:hypothetical protein
MYSIFGREITKYTDIYGVYIRFGQPYIAKSRLARTIYIRYFWRGNHQIYGHIRCTYTVLANPMYIAKSRLARTVYTQCIHFFRYFLHRFCRIHRARQDRIHTYRI